MQQKYRHSDHSQKKKKKYVCNLLDYCKSREPQSLKMVALTDHFRIFWHTLRCLQIWDISLGVFWLVLYIGFKKGIFFFYIYQLFSGRQLTFLPPCYWMQFPRPYARWGQAIPNCQSQNREKGLLQDHGRRQTAPVSPKLQAPWRVSADFF